MEVYRGRDLEIAYKDYISGERKFMDVSADYR